jgi:hypothetical protein
MMYTLYSVYQKVQSTGYMRNRATVEAGTSPHHDSIFDVRTLADAI